MNAEQSPLQELKWFMSDGLDNLDESIKVSEIWNKLNELIAKESTK